MEKDVLYQLKLLQNDLFKKSLEIAKNHNAIPRSHVQLKIIEYLYKHMNEEVYQKDLEALTSIRKSTISGILNTMEKTKVIERLDSIDDKRKKRIVLTEESKQKYKKVSSYFKTIQQNVVKGISEEKLEVFYEVICKMRKNVNKENNKQGGKKTND